MVVVQDQQHLVIIGRGGQLVDQCCYQGLERRWRRRAQQRIHPLADPGTGLVQRGHRMTPEPGRIIVGRIQ